MVWHSAGSCRPPGAGGSAGDRRRRAARHRASNVGSSRRRSASPRRSVVERRPPGAGDGPDLARPDRQAPRVERAAQSQVHLGVAVPARSTTVPSGEGRSRAEPCRRGARMDDEVTSALGLRGQGEVAPMARTTRARSGSTSTTVTSTPGTPTRRRATQSPTMPAHDGDPVADEWRGIPQRVDRLHGARQHRRAAGAFRHDHHRRGRHDVCRLVREEAEHRPSDHLGRPLLHHPDVEVAVLDRAGELALLEGSSHRRVLVGGAQPRNTTSRCRGSLPSAGCARGPRRVAGPAARQAGSPPRRVPGQNALACTAIALSSGVGRNGSPPRSRTGRTRPHG